MAVTFNLAAFTVAGLVALGGTALATDPSGSSDSPYGPVTSELQIAQSSADRQMVRAINRVRAAHDLKRLGQSRSLRIASHRHARWLLLHGRFQHTVRLGPVSYTGRGEVLERHFDGGKRIRRTLRLWMRSRPHRKVLLNPRYREGGARLYQGYLRGEPVSIWAVRLGYR